MNVLMLVAIYYKGTEHLTSLRDQKAIKILLYQGCVNFIRYTRSDLKLYLPNESFIVKENLKYSYVVAEINIENHCLNIRQNGEIKQMIPYTISAID